MRSLRENNIVDIFENFKFFLSFSELSMRKIGAYSRSDHHKSTMSIIRVLLFSIYQSMRLLNRILHYADSR